VKALSAMSIVADDVPPGIGQGRVCAHADALADSELD
jgi:hypothetical protein